MTRRVLVTGGAGFVASHVAEQLVARGDEVVVLDDLSTGVAANVPRGASLVRCDISDPADVRGTLSGEHFDGVVHAAAEASVVRSIADPARSRRVNVAGTANVIDLARRAAASRFVFFSTGGAIYGETPRCAVEGDPLRPISPYGRHKLEGEELVRRCGLSHAILRPANIYGPRQRGDLEGGVVAIFLERYREKRELVVYGDGSAERDYVYATDVAECVLAVLGDRRNDTWNVGTGIVTSVNGLIEHLRRLLGEPTGGVRYEAARAGELQRACVDPGKAAREGLWRSRHTFEQGLRALVAAGA